MCGCSFWKLILEIWNFAKNTNIYSRKKKNNGKKIARKQTELKKEKKS